jgi:hypothetical protein
MNLLSTDVLELTVVLLDSQNRFVFLSMKLNGVPTGVIRFDCEQDSASFGATFALGSVFTFGTALTFNQTFTCARMPNQGPNTYKICLRRGGILQSRSEDTSRIVGPEPDYGKARFP